VTPTQLSRKKYKTSEKGKAARQRELDSSAYKERVNRYQKTEAYKRYHSAYKTSPKGKAAAKRYCETVKGRLSALVRAANQRAKKRGLAFDLNLDQLVCRIEQNGMRCEVTGVPFEFELRRDGRKNPKGPSLDQKIPAQGYTSNNVQIVCGWYNNLKGDLTDNEALSLLNEWRDVSETTN